MGKAAPSLAFGLTALLVSQSDAGMITQNSCSLFPRETTLVRKLYDDTPAVQSIITKARDLDGDGQIDVVIRRKERISPYWGYGLIEITVHAGYARDGLVYWDDGSTEDGAVYQASLDKALDAWLSSCLVSGKNYLSLMR